MENLTRRFSSKSDVYDMSGECSYNQSQSDINIVRGITYQNDGYVDAGSTQDDVTGSTRIENRVSNDDRSTDAISAAGEKSHQLENVAELGGVRDNPSENGSEIPVHIVPGSKQDPFRKYRIIKQLVLVGIWICIGMANEVVGPTLQDLMDRMGVDYEEISRALSSQSIGLIAGALVGGFINEIWYSHMDLFMTLSLMLMAFAALFVPWMKTLAGISVMFSLNGFAEGVINAAGNTLVMHLWLENTASPMHSLHFGFGFGALLAPQIAKPFLSPDADDDADYKISAYENNSTNTTTDPTAESRIEIAYAIIAISVFLFSFILLGFYIKGAPKGFPVRQPTATVREMLSPASCSRGHVVFGVELLICLFIYFIHTVGGERAYGKFLFSFATDADVNFSKSEAANLQSLFWLSFTVGRLSGVPIARFVSVRNMIIGDIVGIIITTSVLAAFAYSVEEILWVFSCFMGFFASVVFPNGMSWSNIYLDMNSMSVMVLIIGGACGAFIYQYLTGYLFEYEGPETLMYVMVGYGVALAITFGVMQALVVYNLRKFKREDQNLADSFDSSLEEEIQGEDDQMEK